MGPPIQIRYQLGSTEMSIQIKYNEFFNPLTSQNTPYQVESCTKSPFCSAAIFIAALNPQWPDKVEAKGGASCASYFHD